jgi:hypothetical protein
MRESERIFDQAATPPAFTDQVISDQEKIDLAKKDLGEFAQAHGLRSLEDRVKRGLEAVGIVALKETSERVRSLAAKLGASYDEVVAVVLDIQLEGPWKYAARFREGTDPATKIWIMLNAANTMGREREMDMTSAEFIQDVKRIDGLLESAAADPENFFSRAHHHVLVESQKRFRVEDGVPISEMDNGFIAMATSGYEAGITQDADGILFVAAVEINDGVFTEWGLHAEERSDRGRMVTFFVNDRGEAVIKKLYPGFVIVLSRNLDLAKAIVKGSTSVTAEMIGQKVYAPTSMVAPASIEDAKIKPTKRIREVPIAEGSYEEKKRSAFYAKLAFAKARETFRDRAIAIIRKMKEQGQGRITNDTLETEAGKTQSKVEQKMEELRYMIELMSTSLNQLPAGINKVFDMAGGAGDLGMAIATEMQIRGKRLDEVTIVDPVEELEVFNRLIVEELPNAEMLKQTIKYDKRALQEVDLPSEALVVAKHPCGDLTDTILEKWVNSKSPMLVLMTCCQDKAKDQPARYNISQADWQKWCKESSKTNAPDPKKRAQGMEAMAKLDNARVNYLRRYGFDVELIQTDKFPKGDVIIAKRRV